ncbi:MAG: sensor histidine kinase [Pseudomonadota bacterium]
MTDTPESGWHPGEEFPRRSTSLKLFAILLVALAPLALIAYLASEQIESSEEAARNDAAANALNLGALRLNSAIASQRAILLRAANAIALGGDEGALCADLQQELPAAMTGQVLAYASRSGESVCGLQGPEGIIGNAMRAGSAGNDTLIAPAHDGLIIFSQGRVPLTRVAAFYSIETLMEIADPEGTMPLARLTLHDGDYVLTLSELTGRNERHLGNSITAQQKVAGLDLTLRLPAERKSSSQYLIRIIPIMMILAAAIIGWLVVNGMLMHPIQQLQNKMRSYKPGNNVQPMHQDSMVAHEIIELDGVFNRLAALVQADKEALAHGLSEQVKLTREVHHRVKNNLQIITSLLNLHARGAENEEIARVYASIQRRVNALAVVHRHHFADTEARRGISLRELICEVVSSFRARAPDSDLNSRTTIHVRQMLVDQDVAMPVTFLLTEILELIQNSGAPGPITISVTPDDRAGFARLAITSPALGDNAGMDAILDGGVAKILQGLSRQLRSTLDQDREDGRFSLAIRLFDTPASERHSDISASVAAAMEQQREKREDDAHSPER